MRGAFRRPSAWFSEYFLKGEKMKRLKLPTKISAFFKKALSCLIAGVLTMSAGSMTVFASDTFTSDTQNHGAIALASSAEPIDGTLDLTVGDTVTITISPYMHVQYTGCLTTPGCPDVCGEELDCFISDKGCKCNTTPIVRTTNISVESSENGIVSISEPEAAGSVLAGEEVQAADVGNKTDGTFTITALQEGVTQIIVNTSLRDWIPSSDTITINVTADQSSGTVPVTDVDAWTTHTPFDEEGNSIQTLFVELTFAKQMEIIDKDALLAEMNLSFGSGLDMENTDVELSTDGKTLTITTSGWNAQVGGVFSTTDVWQNLKSVDGEAADSSCSILVPNGLDTEIISQTIATEDTSASVTTKILRPEDATRGQVHLVVLKNGQPVAGANGLDSYGSTETTHFHDYWKMTASDFVANFVPSLTDTLGSDYIISYEEGSDQFTITAADSQPGDILEFHILSYLNNGTKTNDLSGLNAELSASADIDSSLYTADSYAVFADALAKAQVVAKDSTYYAQTDVDRVAAQLADARDALVLIDTGNPGGGNPDTPEDNQDNNNPSAESCDNQNNGQNADGTGGASRTSDDNTNTRTSVSGSKAAARTGDNANAAVYIFIIAAAGAASAACLRRKKIYR